MRLRIKKLNSAGVAHHFLIAVLVVVAFASFGAYRVFWSSANSSYTGPPVNQQTKDNGCIPGKHKVSGNCQKFATAQEVKADCGAFNLQYDSASNTCKDACVDKFYKKDGKCVATTTASTSNPNCASLNRNAGSGTQCGPCKTNYVDVKGDVNSGACEVSLSNSCTGTHMTYNAKSNTCGCATDFTMQDGVCKPSSTVTCPTNQVKIDGVCVTKAQCNREHTQYDATRNTCVCASDYERNTSNNECEKKKVSSTNPTPTGQCGSGTARCITAAQVKASCDAQFLQYDPTTNKCKDSCKSGYVKKDGKCLDQAEVQNILTERLCRALGRDWVNPRQAEGPSDAPKPSYCSRECIDTDGSTPVDTGKDVTSYCKATVAGSLGASPDISKTDCVAAHHIYIEAAKVCSARCSTGYYLKDAKCNPLASTDTGENGDGESPDGGCLAGAEPNTDGTCEEDNEGDQATDPATLKLDINIDQKTCQLLGREWESGTKDADGKKIKGCNIEKCDKKDVKIVKSENGKPYCQGYVVKIEKPKCDKLHRVWVPEAKGCATEPNQKKKAGAKVLKSIRCEAPYTTYVFKSTTSDECLKPSTVQKLQSIAKSTGTPFVKLTNLSQAGVCNVQPHKHWNGNKCVKDKPATHNTGQGTSTTGSTTSTDGTPGSSSGSGTSGGSQGNGNGGGSTGTGTCNPDIERCNSGTGGSTGTGTCNPDIERCNSGTGGSGPGTSEVTQQLCETISYYRDHTAACSSHNWFPN